MRNFLSSREIKLALEFMPQVLSQVEARPKLRGSSTAAQRASGGSLTDIGKGLCRRTLRP
jgi:hypothetical protein